MQRCNLDVNCICWTKDGVAEMENSIIRVEREGSIAVDESGPVPKWASRRIDFDAFAAARRFEAYRDDSSGALLVDCRRPRRLREVRHRRGAIPKFGKAMRQRAVKTWRKEKDAGA
jgi:hypothetical protein